MQGSKEARTCVGYGCLPCKALHTQRLSEGDPQRLHVGQHCACRQQVGVGVSSAFDSCKARQGQHVR